MNNEQLLIELDLKARELHKLSLQLNPLKEDKANQKAFETYKVRISEKVLCINQDVRFLIKSKTNA